MLRVVAAVVIGGVAGLGTVRTTAYALRTSNIDLARVMDPSDGRITALKAEALLREDSAPAALKRTAMLARGALRQDPTAVGAATTLGVIVQARGEAATARHLLAYAQQLSRRDLQTQIWAIETATALGDIPGALQHYDIALRTSRHAADFLFPILGSAISEPPIRSALVKLFSKRPPWAPVFLDYIAGSNPDQQATARLYAAAAKVGVPVSDGAKAAVIDTLVARGKTDEAWAYYASFRKGARRDQTRDPHFAAMLGTPTPFDWVPANDVGITASIQRTDRGGVLDFAVAPSIGGIVVQQRQLLPAGRYLLQGHSADIDVDGAENAKPFWTLYCPDGQSHGSVDVPNSRVANGTFSGAITVPTGCAVQTLALVARSTSKIGGTTGQFDLLRLSPQP